MADKSETGSSEESNSGLEVPQPKNDPKRHASLKTNAAQKDLDVGYQVPEMYDEEDIRKLEEDMAKRGL